MKATTFKLIDLRLMRKGTNPGAVPARIHGIIPGAWAASFLLVGPNFPMQYYVYHFYGNLGIGFDLALVSCVNVSGANVFWQAIHGQNAFFALQRVLRDP